MELPLNWKSPANCNTFNRDGFDLNKLGCCVTVAPLLDLVDLLQFVTWTELQ